jgi:hypothetical protein
MPSETRAFTRRGKRFWPRYCIQTGSPGLANSAARSSSFFCRFSAAVFSALICRCLSAISGKFSASYRSLAYSIASSNFSIATSKLSSGGVHVNALSIIAMFVGECRVDAEPRDLGQEVIPPLDRPCGCGPDLQLHRVWLVFADFDSRVPTRRIRFRSIISCLSRQRCRPAS